jgi:hypothetical protein
VRRDVANGTFSFNGVNSLDKQSVSVSPHDGGTGYVGSFTVDAEGASNGGAPVNWQFDMDQTSNTQAVSQLYNVSIASSAQPSGTNGPTTQSVSVLIAGPGNDTFVFKQGFGAEVIANATHSDMIELDGFSSVTSTSQLRALFERGAERSTPVAVQDGQRRARYGDRPRQSRQHHVGERPCRGPACE